MSTGIFSIVDESRMASVLETLSFFSHLPVMLIDGNGNTLLRFGGESGYCKKLRESVFTAGECFELHRKAGKRAQTAGGAYVFSCHANLNHIAFPLAERTVLLGTAIIGPFLMDTPDSTLVSALAESRDMSAVFALELYDELALLPVIEPSRVGKLEKLTEYLLSPLLVSERAMLISAQEKLYQQAKISEAIHTYKEQPTLSSTQFFYEKETQLLSKVRTGERQAVKAMLNELIGHVLFYEGGKIEAVRVRAVELTALLSRVAMESGARADSIYSLNSKYISLMYREQNLDDLCYLLQNVVESFMDAAFCEKENRNAYIRQAMRFIADNYSQKITLADVSGSVGLSPNHFSAVFRKYASMGFREYLYRVRVEESKKLLLSTEYSLNDIAVAMGFTDQSHFCKVFKRVTGLSPGKYRL